MTNEKIKTIDFIEVITSEIKRLGIENDRLETESKILRKQLFEQLEYNGKIIKSISFLSEKNINDECTSCVNFIIECKGMVGGGRCASFEDKSLYKKKPNSIISNLLSRVSSIIK